MKKIISFLMASALLLGAVIGVTSCSGDLHDMEGINMSQYGLIGTMNGWGDPMPLTDNGDGTYSITFTGTGNGSHGDTKGGDNWAIRAMSGWDAGAYRMAKPNATGKYDDSAVITADKIDGKTEITVYEGDSGMDCPIISTEKGVDYTMTITPGQGFMTIVISKGEAPKDAFVCIDGKPIKMTLKSKGSYEYSHTVASASATFSILYDGEAYGAESLTLGSDTALTKDGAVMTASVDTGKAYLVALKIGDDGSVKLNVAKDTFKVAYIIGDEKNEFVPMNVIMTNVVAHTFTYKNDMSGWGGGNGTLNFKIINKSGWGGEIAYVGTNGVLEKNKWFDPTAATDGGNNPRFTDLVDGTEYTIMLDGTDPDNVKLMLIVGKPLWITGSTDICNWNWENPKQLFSSDTAGVYKLEYAATTATSLNVKFTGKAGWDDSCNWGGTGAVAVPMTVGGTAVTIATSGGSQNLTVTVTAGSTYIFTVDLNAKTAKIETKV